MTTMILTVRLLSDTTFGRGDGVAGMVDEEVEHDARTGLPFVKGRTLKGLIVEACSDLLWSLRQFDPALHDRYDAMSGDLFGVPGSDADAQGALVIGNGYLPSNLVQAVETSGYDQQDVLEALTTIRYQTAVDPTTNAPKTGSLRSTRVVLRETPFESRIDTRRDLQPDEISWLAACVQGVRRGGLSRNRGTGRLALSLSKLDGAERIPVQYDRILEGGR